MSARFQTIVTLVLLLSAQVAYSATFTANSSIDAPDNNPGDGLCRSDGLPLSSCTLRAAIMEANALAGTHTINLQAGRTYTLTRVGDGDHNGDLNINKSLTIQCLDCETNRAVVDGNGIDRVFYIGDGSGVTLRGFDITGGDATKSGFINGGAVLAAPNIDLVRLMQMRLYGNRAGSGGAIYNRASSMLVLDSEIFDNRAVTGSTGSGSGIYTQSPLILNRSTVHGNRGNNHLKANAVMVHDLNGFGARVMLFNSTISSNFGEGVVSAWGAAVDLRNSTIAANEGNGIGIRSDAPLTIYNTIIARNQTDCYFQEEPIPFDGYNLIGDASCAGAAGPSDLQSTNPLLTPLRLRGQFALTPVHWPRIGSPALSSASDQEFGELACPDVDQIGEPRPQGFNGSIRCDIGATEVPEDAIFFDSLETI